MNAQEFNAIYNEVVASPLVAQGFARRRHDLFLELDDAILALLRFQMKPSGLLQRTSIIFCIRHRFLRQLLDETVPKSAPTNINDYPFKECPSGLSAGAIQTWRYRPINLGVRADDYDEIRYGDAKSFTHIRPALQAIATNTLSGGRALLERLHPEEALRQLRAHGESAWCEKLWIEDYEQFLKTTA